MSYALVRELRERVAKTLTVRRSERTQAGHPSLSAHSERQLALTLITEAVRDLAAEHVAAGRGVPDGATDGSLVRAVEAAIYGAGPLQPLLEDEDLENLDLNGYDEVWATYASKGLVRLEPVADSDEELIDILRSLASYAGPVARPWSTVHPQLDIGLPGGVRISGLLAASARPQVSIRRDRLGPQAFLDRPARGHHDAISLVDLGTLDRQCAAFLTAAVKARANILVVGATDAGKTTLLRAMANAIPAAERIITIEQARELRLGREASLHANVVELETVLPSPDGKGGLDGADLVRRSKRMNPDRLIFGEVLAGAEARAMLEAMLQGTDGSMSTIHARNAYGAIARLIINLGALREPVQPATAAALIGQAIDFVVYVRHATGSRRLVTEILEISGHQGETVSHATIFASPERSEPAIAVDSTDRTRGGTPHRDVPASDAQEYTMARRDPRIPLRRAALLARHGYTDELGERLNAETGRPTSRRSGATRSGTYGSAKDLGRNAGRNPGRGSSRDSNWELDGNPERHHAAPASGRTSEPSSASDVREFTGSVAGPAHRRSDRTGPVAAPGRSVYADPGSLPDLADFVDPAGPADPRSPADPTGIPQSLIGNEGQTPPATLTRTTLHLPGDGRGPHKPIAHGHHSEPLTPTYLPLLSQDGVDPARAGGAGSHGAHSVGADGAGPTASESSGPPASGPIIDLGARRRDPSATGAHAVVTPDVDDGFHDGFDEGFASTSTPAPARMQPARPTRSTVPMETRTAASGVASDQEGWDGRSWADDGSPDDNDADDDAAWPARSAAGPIRSDRSAGSSGPAGSAAQRAADPPKRPRPKRKSNRAQTPRRTSSQSSEQASHQTPDHTPGPAPRQADPLPSIGIPLLTREQDADRPEPAWKRIGLPRISE